jgi:hypothetical protein
MRVLQEVTRSAHSSNRYTSVVPIKWKGWRQLLRRFTKTHTALDSVILLALAGSIAAPTQVWARSEISTSTEGFQELADSGFNARVARPAYPKHHPKVLFDEAHNNFYTSLGTYKPFADLINSDGYGVVPNKSKFSKTSLGPYDLLVIVNASGPPGHKDSSPFTDEECDAVRDWVKAGGGLLLITDHAPFGAAVAELAQRFDVDVTRGHTFETTHYNKESNDQTELVFARENGLVGEHPITRGRDETERINRVMTFSGTSLRGAGGSVALLKLADTALDVLPPDRKPNSPDEPPGDHRTVSASGRAQALAMTFGKGRVVVLGEAAMLSALVSPNGFRYGMNISGTENRQLALNIMHWLSGLLK